ncbi:hypothetical protein F7725_013894 [Dissostichus mawsoni]|uniref:Uncharacterized protein n=1 Tax=Dissostichus mawsoni TaxID=36200 RepID=A0A7J5YWJ9_DISMA|nr:hypothetical protein F7725_013879 [Dissostichus mawsoni]KAF3853206.1 hypothetical protein F7725_013894 [Dissostichus mawsoni]
MEEHAGPEHGEVLGEAVGRLQGAALQRLQTLTAPSPLLHAVVLTHCAEHTHRHTHRTTGDQRRGQVDGERLGDPYGLIRVQILYGDWLTFRCSELHCNQRGGNRRIGCSQERI